MKVEEFLSNRDPGDETEHVEGTDPDFQHVTSLTPSGLQVLYSWAPKRLYRVRRVASEQYAHIINAPWTEVPSVTSVLGILDKSGALSWWAQRIGVEGVMELFSRELLNVNMLGGIDYWEEAEYGDDAQWSPIDSGGIVDLLTKHKISINHVTSKAADRGVNVHNALESWAIDQSYRANPDLYEEHERGYIVGLNSFLDDIGEVKDIQAEVMVGSLRSGFAGRYDLRLFIQSPRDVAVKTYPKRADKREEIKSGTYLIDLKTSKDCYSSHSLQLAAYEQASIECGYGSTDYRAVLRVTADGKYEFRRANAEFSDFKAVLTAYTAMQRKAWFS